MLNTKIENPVTCEMKSLIGFIKLKMIARRKFTDSLLKSVVKVQ